ncbi:GGDEF domain-containing protein [Sulfuricystis multivorans]|uniref:GGDEF domain-containing protein n=1 Tax=Sulfuricystis multivorans TaxID=2211108 RepID=UPI000F824437|nr:GGDEF domain-containing protein [Sulfuricystis multivorans]
MNLGTVRHRLHNDFQLAILTLLGSLAVLSITPFAIYRAIDHEWVPFVMDVGIIAVISGGLWYAWRSGDSERPSTILSYFVGVMAIVASHVLGKQGTYWIYPALIANFFLTQRKHALIIAAAVLALIMATGGWHRETHEAASFAVTLILSVLLAYVFAYRTAEQREQLQRLASLDALTGIHNRRGLLRELERARRILARDGRAHGLLILDLDHFKQINDRFGHARGDEVLIRFARLLANSLRPHDRLFRYGGEEFVVLTQAEDAGTLRAIAEKLRLAAENGLDDGHGQAVTTSIGGAILRTDESIETWLARADGALYLAKHGGRNRVVIDTEAGKEAPAGI